MIEAAAHSTEATPKRKRWFPEWYTGGSRQTSSLRRSARLNPSHLNCAASTNDQTTESAGQRETETPSAESYDDSAPSTIIALVKLWLSEWTWLSVLIIGGCCSNVYALELINRQVPRSMALVTFSQFLLGYIPKEVQSQPPSWLPFRITIKSPVIPIYHWGWMVVLFWSVSMMNNLALDYQIDMPLHIIFKSGGLLINMLLGFSLLGKKYTVSQVVSVLAVSIGVILSTYASASDVKRTKTNDISVPISEWLTGIALMSFSLIMSAFLGLYQEHIYKKYGKQWREGLFFTHFLGLPFFLFMPVEVAQQAALISSSSRVSIHSCLEYLGMDWLAGILPSELNRISVPHLWLTVLVNCLTQYACISGVHQLTTVTTSLTVNLVLTFRKFISLLLSVYYFEAAFGPGHWMGTVLVFLGTFLYSTASTRKLNMRRSEADRKKR